MYTCVACVLDGLSGYFTSDLTALNKVYFGMLTYHQTCSMELGNAPKEPDFLVVVDWHHQMARLHSPLHTIQHQGSVKGIYIK